MPQIKDCALDINLNKDLKGILDAANFGTSWSKKRQDACNKIETFIKGSDTDLPGLVIDETGSKKTLKFNRLPALTA